MTDTLIQKQQLWREGLFRFEATAHCTSSLSTTGGFHNNTASTFGSAKLLTMMSFSRQIMRHGTQFNKNSPSDISIELTSAIGDSIMLTVAFSCGALDARLKLFHAIWPVDGLPSDKADISEDQNALIDADGDGFPQGEDCDDSDSKSIQTCQSYVTASTTTAMG